MNAVVAVEASARILRGLAVPYLKPTLVADPRADGGWDIAREVFDRESLIIPEGRLLPIVVHHDDSRPVGKVTRTWSTSAGLEVEAQLVGGADVLDHVRELIGAGVQSALSIGFVPNPKLDVWTKGTTSSQPPTVLRRGARLREISLVIHGAFADAKVHRVSNRTERQQAWRLEEDRKNAMRAELERERAAKAKARLAAVQAELEASERRHAEWRARQTPPPPPPSRTLDPLPDLVAARYELPDCPTRPDKHASDLEWSRYNSAVDLWLDAVHRANRQHVSREQQRLDEERLLFATAHRGDDQWRPLQR